MTASNDTSRLEQLDASSWAWQFLRRNPAYRADWQWFHTTWQALEADYGRPPERDFTRWKQDERAYRNDDFSPADAAEAGEQLMIECYMGAKWGFYKFPLDPAIEAPSPEQLQWRAVDPHALPPLTVTAVEFDLSLPLAEQLEQAKRALQVMQRQHSKAHPEQSPRLKNRLPSLVLYIRILDGEATDGSPTDIAAAQALVEGGYRRLLLLK